MRQTKPAPIRRPRASPHTRKRGDAVRDRLIDACNHLLSTNPPSGITTAMLLTEAGVARGTLYHHFGSLSALIERTLLEAFSSHVDANIAALRDLVDRSKNRAEFVAGLRQVTKVSQGPARKDTRFARARLIVYSETSAAFRRPLAQEQERLTAALEDIVVTAQKMGWVRRTIKPRPAAVLIQAYTLGKIVDDISESRMTESDWNTLIDDIVIGGMVARN